MVEKFYPWQSTEGSTYIERKLKKSQFYNLTTILVHNSKFLTQGTYYIRIWKERKASS